LGKNGGEAGSDLENPCLHPTMAGLFQRIFELIFGCEGGADREIKPDGDLVVDVSSA
jgi:hypothetical protein